MIVSMLISFISLLVAVISLPCSLLIVLLALHLQRRPAARSRDGQLERGKGGPHRFDAVVSLLISFISLLVAVVSLRIVLLAICIIIEI